MSYNLVDIMVVSVLALVTLGVGMSIRPSDYRRIFLRPKRFFVGLTMQMIALPLIAFVIAWFMPISPEWKVGLVILSLCPGGATANVVTYYMKGNTALAISLTGVNGILTLLSIPLLVNLSLRFFGQAEANLQLPFWQTFGQIFLVTIIPAILGAFIQYNFPKVVEKLRNPLKIINLVLLATVFVIKFIAPAEHGGSGISVSELVGILPAALLLNIVALVAGHLTAKVLKLGRDNEVTISIGVGMQNTTLAFLIAGTLLQNQEMIKPALVYAMFSFWTGMAYGYLINRREVRDSFWEFFGK